MAEIDIAFNGISWIINMLYAVPTTRVQVRERLQKTIKNFITLSEIFRRRR